MGVFLISVDFADPAGKFKRGLAFYMLPACFLASIIGVIFKYVTLEGNFWVSSFWQYAGLGFFGLLLYIFVPKYRREFALMNKSGGIKIFTLNTLSEIFTTWGNLLTNYAILLAPVVMDYLVGGFQPAILLFLTVLATKFFPDIIKENIGGNVLFYKIIAIVIMVLGSIMLFL